MESSPRIHNAFAISPALARTLPFAIYIGFLILESVLPQSGGQFDARWLYLVKVICVAIAIAALWPRYTELRDRPRPTAAAWTASAVVGVVIFVIWISLDRPWAVIGNNVGWNPTEANGAVNWILASARLIGAAAVVPVMEELFWRSLVLRWIRNSDFLSVAPARSGTLALIVCSALFGLEHHEWLAGLIAGLAYAGTYMRFGNLWCAVVAHATTNLLLGVWVLRTGQWQFW